MTAETQQRVVDAFRAEFGEAPAIVVRAPGRVNLIGEHTDYNDGFVMPMAIDRAVWVALRPRNDRQVRVLAFDFDRPVTFDLDTLRQGNSGPAAYITGIAWALQQAGYTLCGWEGTLLGDVPIGAGLSSSAALELATARAFSVVSDFEWDATSMARLAQRAENEWVGVSSGIMDQMISASGQAGTALLIDCRSLATRPAPLPADTVVVILDTGTRRELVGSAYNERRSQCEVAARHFGAVALRDVSPAQFFALAHELDAVTRQRARHVITENERVWQTLGAMLAGDAVELGRLMNASHASLRDDFAVSSDALNAIVEVAQQHSACYGARMTGAGFGGCAVALVRADVVTDFVGEVTRVYEKAMPHQPQVYICHAMDGASVIVPG